MKEFLLALLTLSLFNRRKHQQYVGHDRRKITGKQAQKMLVESIEKLSRSLDRK